MKLFITNKVEFEDQFPDTSGEIHKKAFNILRESVSENNIPIILLADYSDLNCALFNFKRILDDVYFYEFTGSAG